MKHDKRSTIIIIIYGLFVGFSFMLDFEPGREIGFNFGNFTLTMLPIVPLAFILIGLFEVWVKRETVEKHLGTGSGPLSYLWAVLLSGTTVGGIYVAFPLSYTLYQKGARLSVIFTYLSSAAITRIPMVTFEASLLGIKFTAIRFIVSLPLVILVSILLEKYLLRHGFKMSHPDEQAITSAK
jgi:uncharacterized membrane protein YraQ (UPF0718 family)